MANKKNYLNDLCINGFFFDKKGVIRDNDKIQSNKIIVYSENGFEIVQMNQSLHFIKNISCDISIIRKSRKFELADLSEYTTDTFTNYKTVLVEWINHSPQIAINYSPRVTNIYNFVRTACSHFSLSSIMFTIYPKIYTFRSINYGWQRRGYYCSSSTIQLSECKTEIRKRLYFSPIFHCVKKRILSNDSIINFKGKKLINYKNVNR